MYDNKRILALIPARGGSKGLPGKNIKPLSGKPLIAWTIKQALASKYLDRVVVSTDDRTIAKISRKYGAEVPFIRPAELATDRSPTCDAVIHALKFFENKGERYDYIALLEPTSPLRKAIDINGGITKLANKTKADSLVSLGLIHMEHPSISKKVKDGYVIPYLHSKVRLHQRQQFEEAYFPYGVLYMAKVNVYKKSKTFYTDRTIPFFIERWQNYEVDDDIDLEIIAKLIEIKKGEMNG